MNKKEFRTLKEVRQINGFNILDIERIRRENPEWIAQNNQVKPEIYDKKFRENSNIIVDHARKTITFKFQHGSVKENGVNGVQVDTLIETSRIMLNQLDREKPCIENKSAIYSLNKALKMLDMRKIRLKKENQDAKENDSKEA